MGERCEGIGTRREQKTEPERRAHDLVLYQDPNQPNGVKPGAMLTRSRARAASRGSSKVPTAIRLPPLRSTR
jgi:hypothetical protein